MEAFSVVEGTAAPLPAANIDTDVIMPKRYLKGVDRSGLADGVFHDLRFKPTGEPDPAFVLNKPGWRGASFLVVGANFGTGSSREHAVWGLRQLGIHALIGTSYAGIFFDNCARNGLLAITLNDAQIAEVFALADDPTTNRLVIDLPAQTIAAGSGSFRFEISPLLKRMLLEGLDTVGVTLSERGAIEGFERDYLAQRPWLKIAR